MSVTLKHVAEEAGLSWQTASKVLNNQGHLFRPQTCQAIFAAAERLGYIPNGAARTMRSNQTRQVGLLLRNEAGHRYHNLSAFILLLGINARLEQDGYLLSVVRLGDLDETGRKKSRVFNERMLDGVLVFGGFSSEACDWIQNIIPRCVWVDTNKADAHNCLRRDEIQAGQLVAQHLIRLGYRRVTWATREIDESSHYSLIDRGLGLREELLKHGVGLDILSQELRADTRVIYPDLPLHLSADRAIVAYDVNAASAIQSAASSMGYTAGHDYGLVCCDDSPQVFESWPGLCRVANDRFQMGFEAADMMLNLVGDPKHPPPSGRAATEWVIGNTAWGPPSSTCAAAAD